MAGCWEPALDEFSRETGHIRRELIGADVADLLRSHSSRDRSAVSKAFAYVWLSAAHEAFVRNVLAALASDLTARAMPIRTVNWCLLALSEAHSFAVLQDVRGQKRWAARLRLLEKIESEEPFDLEKAESPLDRRTCRPEHYHSLWSVYGLPGSPLPSSRHALALNDLADGRNEVAHGRTPPRQFGRRKVLGDVTRLVELTEDVAIHLASAVERYLAEGLYARGP